MQTYGEGKETIFILEGDMDFDKLEKGKQLHQKLTDLTNEIHRLDYFVPYYKYKGNFIHSFDCVSNSAIDACRYILRQDLQRQYDKVKAEFEAL